MYRKVVRPLPSGKWFVRIDAIGLDWHWLYLTGELVQPVSEWERSQNLETLGPIWFLVELLVFMNATFLVRGKLNRGSSRCIYTGIYSEAN